MLVAGGGTVSADLRPGTAWDSLELVRGLLPDLARRARGALRRQEGIEEQASQLPAFVDLVDDVALEVDRPLRVEAGAVPEGLEAVYVAGGWYRTRDRRIDHLLDAYPCLVELRVGGAGGRVRARRLDDPLFDAEERAGRVLRKGILTMVGPGAGRVTHVMGRSAMHDAIAWDGRVLLTAQNRYVTLDEELRDAARDVLEGLVTPSSTLQYNMHPQVDPVTGRLVTHTYSIGPTFATSFRFIELDPGGGARTRDYQWPGYLVPHAFAFTRGHYLLPAISARYHEVRFVLGLGRGALDDTRDEDTGGLVWHVVPRDPAAAPFTVRFRMTGFVYHVTNSWEADGRLEWDAFVSNLNPEREASQFELDTRRPVHTNLGGVFRFSVDLATRRAHKRLLAPGVQRVTFDAIDESRRGLPYDDAWFCANDQHEGHSSSVTHLDTRTGRALTWSTPERVFFRQPRFVARAGAAQGAQGEGWLLVPAYSLDTTRLLVFEARRVEAGPVAVLAADARLPYINHGWAMRAER